MAIHYTPRIITDGLVLYYNIANKKSYPGSGTTIYDLTTNGYNGTMNGSGFSYANDFGGSLLLDTNASHYISMGGLNLQTLGAGRQMSIMFGVKQTKFGTGGNNDGNSRILQGADNGYDSGWRIISEASGTPVATYNQQHNFSMGATSAYNGVNMYDPSLSYRFAISAFSQNNSTVDAFCNDGFNRITSMNTYVNGTNSATMFGAGYGVGCFTGYFSFIMIYNRSLSRDEILKNYSALKKRFDL